MKNYGLSSVSEFLRDQIVYRNLQPAEKALPGFADLSGVLNIGKGARPRKTQLDYARVIACILAEAQKLRGVHKVLQRLVFVGDTRMLDGTAFSNLCQAGGWDGVAFIGSENCEPASFEIEELAGGGKLYLANRWAALADFEQFCLSQGIPLDETTAVVLDLDKTTLGARGRNAHPIDQARISAVQRTVADLLGEAFDAQRFRSAYDLFNQVEFHSFTADNQDYLAYICLVVGSGLDEAVKLAQRVRQGNLQSFDEYISWVDSHRKELPDSMAAMHAEIYHSVRLGDPTPFKAFRRNEYLMTVARMGFLEADAPLETLLSEEILITQEVRQAALKWQDRGALLFGLSDKPDEATFPSPELCERGYLPLHHTQTHAVGS